MSQETAETVRRVRIPLVPETRRHRTLDERIVVRFPGLARQLSAAWARLPQHSRLRRALLVRRVRQGFATLDRRDFDLLVIGLDPGVELHMGHVLPDIGPVFHGHDGYREVWRHLLEAGAEGLSLGAGGALAIGTSLGTLRDSRPQSFQRRDGRRVAIDSRYALAGSSYGFALGRYDRSRPLVIDPGLVYSTFLGGTSDEQGNGIAVDGSGRAHVTGVTTSANFPTTAGAFDTTHNGANDAFVTKLNASGSALSYSTFLGGTTFEQGLGIAVDGSGRAHVTGVTASGNFPTTAGAFDTTHNGSFDAFVTKLDLAPDCPSEGDDDGDDDGLDDADERTFLTLLSNADSDNDGIKDGNDDADGDGEDDEDEDDESECPDDEDGDGTDDEDEDD